MGAVGVEVVMGDHGLAMGLQETYSTSDSPLPAAANPGHSKLHWNPVSGDVASCKGALGCDHHGPCANNCAYHPAFPLGCMSACSVSVHS